MRDSDAMVEGVCESCHGLRVLADVVNPAEADLAPFRVCAECERRLLAHALRPREWFRLRALHGWREDLDMYDDAGQAQAPDVPVDDAAAHPFPNATSPSMALDIAYVKNRFPRELLAILASDPAATLSLLESDVAARGTPLLRARAYEIAAIALGQVAESFVRAQWAEAPSSEGRLALARASAACLPRPEALARVLAAIVDPSAPGRIVDRVVGLCWFQDEAALDAIENLVEPPVMEAWGRTAAACGLGWPRAARWLAAGRPLSLVALDALATFHAYDTTSLKELAPRLRDPPSNATIRDALTHQAHVDPAPRVRKIVARLLRAYRD